MTSKKQAKIIVDKYADLMLPKKDRYNELEFMIEQALEKRIKKTKYTQTFNPRAKYWIKINKETCKIVSTKSTPYKGIEIK